MKKQTYCKIVKDILPNYIEKMTSDETNEFVEKHLSECESCKQTFKEMISNIDLEVIEDREINYLKKIKRKNTIRILSVIILAIILITSLILFFINYRIVCKENGKYVIEKTMIDDKKISNYDILILNGKRENENGIENILNIKWYVIIETDTKKCVNIISETSNYKNGKEKQEYELLKNNWQEFLNTKINDNKIYVNINDYNGNEKENIIKIFKEKYEYIEEYEI